MIAALTEHAGLIADEVLGTDFAQGEADDSYGTPFTDEGLTLTFRLRKA
ncbi:Isoleucine--tRNA ligase OS=Streptomyces alboniger OX=132473 GN=ileS PE=3 SV=1 [Streptomyces alboniger]